jgi:sialate O-acetylesterase
MRRCANPISGFFRIVLSFFLCVVCCPAFAGASATDLAPAPIFGNAMVLQRDRSVPVWGAAAPGAKVTVSFSGQTRESIAGGDGRWEVRLDSLALNVRPQTMLITSNSRTIEIRDIVVGDVWFCSGQSNMQHSMREEQPTEDLERSDDSLLRQYRNGSWHAASPQTIGDFSAVGYYFARRIRTEHKDVPIGLITVAVGATAIELWTPVEAYRSVPGAEETIAAFSVKRPDGTSDPVGSLFERGVRPLVPYAIRGILWYQGESNQEDGEAYFEKFRVLIESWRTIWGQHEIPFYFVQLANYKKPSEDPGDMQGYCLVRETQRRALAIPNTQMAVAIDVGDLDSIHPRNKTDVGERLALIALARDYGHGDRVHSGPLFREMKKESGKIRIFFDHVHGGLMVGKKVGRAAVQEDRDDGLRRFVIAGSDRKWHWADAVIDGETVVVSSPNVPDPVAVRYAFAKNPLGCNLYNRDGLPASPFRTDSW